MSDGVNGRNSPTRLGIELHWCLAKDSSLYAMSPSGSAHVMWRESDEIKITATNSACNVKRN